MGKISVGNVVFVSFPFSDLTHAKLRPALVLAYAGREDWVLCQITSKPYADNQAIEILDEHFEAGGLGLISYVRPAKLFTANESLIRKQVGRLKPETHRLIVLRIKELLETGGSGYITP